MRVRGGVQSTIVDTAPRGRRGAGARSAPGVRLRVVRLRTHDRPVLGEREHVWTRHPHGAEERVEVEIPTRRRLGKKKKKKMNRRAGDKH